MEFIGCGCKICNLGLGATVNEMILNHLEPSAVLRFLDSKGCKVSEKLLRKHLSAFSIDFPETLQHDFDTEIEPIPNNLIEIDFTQYKIDLSNPEIALELLQKITLQVYLNQSRITLHAQQKVIDGICPDLPKDTLRNQSTALDMLDRCTGLSMIVNQQQAIKTVENMGLEVNVPMVQNVQN